MKSWPILTSVLLSVSGIFTFVPALNSALLIDYSVVMQGEIWRLLTGHLVHADVMHFFWNGLGLFVLGSLVEQYRRGVLIISLLVGIVAVDILLLSAFSTLQQYCGLSGVLNTLLVVALWQQWRVTQSHWITLTAVACAVKFAVEIRLQDSVLTALSWPAYPAAHGVGMLGGLLLLGVSYLRGGDFLLDKQRNDRESTSQAAFI